MSLGREAMMFDPSALGLSACRESILRANGTKIDPKILPFISTPHEGLSGNTKGGVTSHPAKPDGSRINASLHSLLAFTEGRGARQPFRNRQGRVMRRALASA